jgi:acyl dehydratase
MTTSSSVSAPWFEDFSPGLEFDAPAVTLTDGHAAIYQAITADRLRLPLDRHEAQRFTGDVRGLVHPMLTTNIAIGQSTWASQRVKANLFYRGLVLRGPVTIGDTLYTRTRVVGLRQNRRQAGRAATGMVALEMHTTNQRDQLVLHCWRCPMIPCQDPQADTGHADNLDSLGSVPDSAELLTQLPAWNLASSARWLGMRAAAMNLNIITAIESRDTITSAPELVRLTLNMAMAHTDASLSYLGERLVYGGHTISLAFAQLTRALPNIVSLLAWESCDHTAPVVENDRLRSCVTLLDRVPVPDGRSALLRLRVEAYAARGTPETESRVLDWVLWVWSL